MIFAPRVNDDLTVTLPSEQMRAKVTRVIDRNTVIVQIGQPMMRTHNFRKDDLVGCRRTQDVLGESWQAIEVRPALPDLPIGDRANNGGLPKAPKQPGFAQKTGESTPKPLKKAKIDKAHAD
jgi:hypothetical protein